MIDDLSNECTNFKDCTINITLISSGIFHKTEKLKYVN